LERNSRQARVLLLHEGELGDVRDLLCDLDIPFEESRTKVPICEQGPDWALLIATPQRILDLEPQPNPGSRRVQVAIGDSDSRMLRNAMTRLDVDFFICRPVHMEALRLLLLQAVYEGPEKRRARRVNVGLPVRVRTGLRWREVILIDLSQTGCRLLSHQPLERGLKLTVAVPAGRQERSTLSVKGRVLRQSDSGSRTVEGQLAHVVFDALSDGMRERLERVVDEFASGPARSGPREENRDARQRMDKPRERPPAEPLPRTILGAPADKAPQRRSEPRRIFSRRLVALGSDGARVLVGRDLSPSGIRVDPNPFLCEGEFLTLALPWREGLPLVVKARVLRHDGERGLVLRFDELSEETAEIVERMAGLLPVCDLPAEDEEPAWVIVPEVSDQER